jgi:ketosteroid isomerase-like protein
MSRKNVEIVRTIYDAWGREEFPGPTELMDAEIEYVNPEGAIEPGTRKGLQAFGHAVEKVFEAWEFWRMEPVELRAVGDQVVVSVRYQARGRNSGAEAAGVESALWTVREGRVVRYEWFHGADDAFQAAGLRE